MSTIRWDQGDRDEIREAMQGVVGFVPTDAEIDQALSDTPHLAALASEWSWNDTEVRDGLAVLLEKARAAR